MYARTPGDFTSRLFRSNQLCRDSSPVMGFWGLIVGEGRGPGYHQEQVLGNDPALEHFRMDQEGTSLRRPQRGAGWHGSQSGSQGMSSGGSL